MAFPVAWRVCIQTLGCQMNERDSETMAAVLSSAGHDLVESAEGAEVVILNSCSVRDGAELRAIGRLRQLLWEKKKHLTRFVGVAGCMAQRLGSALFQRVPGLDFVLGTRQFARVGEVLERLAGGERGILLLDGPGGGDGLRRWNRAGPSAFVTVASGCPMACSYCIVPRTRGKHRSRPAEHIEDEVRRLAAAGTKEIVLLGQIVNFYGRSGGGGKMPFVRLLERLHPIDGIERIRFLSPHPCGFPDELLRCFSDLPKLCPWLHLPIQSGSDRILRRMRRGYDRARVLGIIQRLRANNPLFSISTDLIVGFPGESDGDFQETESLFSAVDFDMAYIFKFSPRSTTPAAEMADQVAAPIAAERHRILLHRLGEISLRRNRLFLNRTQQVLVERPSTRDPRLLIGHTAQQKKVFFPGAADAIGRIIPIRICHATVSALRGRREDEASHGGSMAEKISQAGLTV